jgi:hypothetical protein
MECEMKWMRRNQERRGELGKEIHAWVKGGVSLLSTEMFPSPHEVSPLIKR